MGKTLSPLRYPGGKSQLSRRVAELIRHNHFQDHIYVEPFAGGFGVGLYLLDRRCVNHAILNDSDRHVYHFWDAALHRADELERLIRTTPISLEERARQKAIYAEADADPLEDGFATLYLNRVNYSGVLFAGPIGGKEQKSGYKLDCRFHKEDIIRRVRLVSSLRDRIELFHMDASALITQELPADQAYFLNMDPPYVLKGKSLYAEYFTEAEHRAFGQTVQEHLAESPWIITYDNSTLVREIYADYTIREFELYHSAHDRAKGTELLITNLPEDDLVW